MQNPYFNIKGIPGKPGLDGERGAVGQPGPTGAQVSTQKK